MEKPKDPVAASCLLTTLLVTVVSTASSFGRAYDSERGAETHGFRSRQGYRN